ncbi:helix-turn-helix protein [Actinorugispora endophytica]|uniref:Helix-turn-helix protein n=1 Tax=Actinorugispora endophytica TaxID=1605990 RepID=A0A4R6V6Q8_9ACTN|nr:helix-turn-helix protein [Actinorugispora endophytica]
MTEPRRSPTVRRKRLSTELKRRREAAGKTAERAATDLGWSRAKITFIETNRWTKPSSDDVADLLDLYGTPADEKAALLALVRDARKKGWWAKYSDVLGEGSYTGLEAEASLLRSYDGLLVPGLLQTPAYAEAVMLREGISDESELRRRLEARTVRQTSLSGEDRLTLHALIDEAALQRLVGGPDVMREQLNKVVEANSQANIEIRVIPNSAGAHSAMTGQFVILDFPEAGDAPVVFIETGHSGLFLEEPEEIRTYTMMYDNVRSLALTPSKSNELIATIIDSLEQ